MKKVLKIINIIAAAGIVFMAVFLPIIGFEGGTFSMSFMDTFSWLSEAGGLAVIYGVSVVLPSLIVLAAAIINYVPHTKYKMALPMAIVTGISMVAAVIMYFAVLMVYFDNIEFFGEPCINVLFIVEIVIYAVSTGCAVIEYMIKEDSQQPSQRYSQQPSQQLSQQYSQQPSQQLSQQYSQQPSQQISLQYSQQPSQQISQQYSQQPSQQLSQQYSHQPSQQISQQYSQQISQQYSQQPSQQLSQQPLRPVIRCESGDYVGAEFPCEGKLIIGSDPQLANVIISGDKISGDHCIVSYVVETDSYLVVDGSLHGVVAEPPGTRLPAHIAVSLPRGTMISIGSGANRFMLV